MQGLGPHPRPTESEYAFTTGVPGDSYAYTESLLRTHNDIQLLIASIIGA
jgi:hypothetical protein